jgi:hypothetical protein
VCFIKQLIQRLCLLAAVFKSVFVGHQAVAQRILHMDTGMSPYAPGVDAVAEVSQIISSQMPQGWLKLFQMARAGEAF